MMQIINCSKVHSTESLERVIKFCSSRAKWSADTLLILNDRVIPGMYTDGITKPGSYFIVTLHLSNGRLSYPYYMEPHVEEIGSVYIRSFQEEVLFVLAHELQHVADLYNDNDRYTDHELEVRAEKTALKRLLSWRPLKVTL